MAEIAMPLLLSVDLIVLSNRGSEVTGRDDDEGVLYADDDADAADVPDTIR